MGKLFLFETRKLIKQKSIYICLAIAVALIILTALVFAMSEKLIEGGEIIFGTASFTKGALTNSSFFLLLGVIVSLFCCDDYSNGTIKNIYAKGFSHTQVYFTKYLFSLILSLVLAAVCILVSYIIGAAFARRDDCGNLGAVMVCELVTVIGYHGIFFAVSMMLCKVGGSLAINIIAPIIFGIVLSLLTVLLQTSVENTKIDFGYIWFDSVYNELGSATVKAKEYVRAVLMSLIYAGGFVTLGYFINRRKEV
ncbi:MAG: ABC transporter permease [Clostridia bacterium]|nr:ABC transporter permease [Clostridia bacterium]MDE7264797.1 ABC transporter permease [Clostridia bacterium]